MDKFFYNITYNNYDEEIKLGDISNIYFNANEVSYSNVDLDSILVSNESVNNDNNINKDNIINIENPLIKKDPIIKVEDINPTGEGNVFFKGKLSWKGE